MKSQIAMEKILRVFRPIARIVLPRMVIVGLDIQDRHIASVASLRKLERAFIPSSGIRELPENAIEDGRLAAGEPVFQAIQSLVQTIPFSRLQNEPVLVISLPPHHIYTETAIFPLMNEKELEGALQLKLETSLPWRPHDAYIDWRRLDIGDPKKIAVFITAIPKQILDEYLGVFSQGKWRVAACEFHLISLARLLNISGEEPSILILLDEDGAEFAIFHKGKMVSHNLEKAIAGKPVEAALSYQARRLATYAQGELGLKIAHVYLFDKAGIESQIETLQRELEIPVKYFVPPVGFDPRLFIAAGASLRKFGIPEESINLIPVGSGGRFHENLIIRTLGLWLNILFSTVLILMVVFGGAFLFLRGQRQALEGETKTLQASLERQFAQSRELIQRADAFNQLVAAMTKASRSRSRVGDALSLVLQALPAAGVEVRHISKPSPDAPFVVTIAADTRDHALEFKKRLEASKKFTVVDIPFTELVPEKNLIINVTLQ